MQLKNPDIAQKEESSKHKMTEKTEMTERYSTINKDGGFVFRWILFVIFAALFALDAWFVVSGRSAALDEQILDAFIDMREPAFSGLVKAITFCGDVKVVAVICVILIILPGRMKVGLPVALMTGAGALVHMAVKAIVQRPRPDELLWLIEEDDYSFPSGHSNVSMLFYVALAVILGRILIAHDRRILAAFLRIVFVLFAVLIGLSRPYLGVHYPTDIFGGWMLALLLAVLFFFVYDYLWPAKWRISTPQKSTGS